MDSVELTTSDALSADSDIEFSDEHDPKLEFENSDVDSDGENTSTIQSNTSDYESEDEEGDDTHHVPPDSLEVIITFRRNIVVFELNI